MTHAYLLFFLFALIPFYAVIGYPAWMIYSSKHKPVKPMQALDYQPITVILVVHNGAETIAQRIENFHKQDYPQEMIQIIIVDDGSSDETATIIEQYSDIELIQQSTRQGKSAGLQLAVAKATTELVVFSDVRQQFSPDAFRILVHKLQQPGVGAVSGNLILDSAELDLQSSYWDIEKRVRMAESNWRSAVGVTGAIYAARRETLPLIPKDLLLDDVFIPMHVARNGYRVEFEPNAIAYDTTSKSLREEFTRKVRTTAGNFQLLKLCPWLLSPTKNPLWFEYLSHKISRIILPWSLLCALAVSIIYRHDPVFETLLYIQFLAYIVMLLCVVTGLRNIHFPFQSAINSVALLVGAALWGGVQAMFGSAQSLWKTR